MSASTNALGIAPGGKGLAAYNTLYSVNLGRIYEIDGAHWRLVKTSTSLTSCGRFAVVSAVSGGLPTYAVTTTTTANNVLVTGVLHADQVDLASGDFCLVQVSGYAEVVSAAAIGAKGAITTSTTAGKCDDLTATVGDTFGYALESAAGADENVAVRLCNLV